MFKTNWREKNSIKKFCVMVLRGRPVNMYVYIHNNNIFIAHSIHSNSFMCTHHCMILFILWNHHDAHYITFIFSTLIEENINFLTEDAIFLNIFRCLPVIFPVIDIAFLCFVKKADIHIKNIIIIERHYISRYCYFMFSLEALGNYCGVDKGWPLKACQH